MRTRIKICGLTNAEDARAAVIAGADAIGLVFYPPSPRAVSIDQAAAIIAGLPAFVVLVGLFVDASREYIEAILREIPLDLLQFHGEESPNACARYGRRWIKAVRMRPGVDLRRLYTHYAGAAALLLDTYHPGVPGGTGRGFDWALIPAALRGEVILAGGLDPENIETAVRLIRPYAVDVSGGVERSLGNKDVAKMVAFIQGVQRGDASPAEF